MQNVMHTMSTSMPIMIQNDVFGNAKLEGMEEGRVEGRSEGRAEEKNNIARKMLANGLSIEADIFNYRFD